MDIRTLQLYKLEILKDVIKICEENNIKYFLYAGTLLGCIGHEGYIPWDDDVDIALTWNEYKKLLCILKDKEEYFIQNIWTEKNYPCLWTQVRVKGTTSMPKELKGLKMHWGICIDIFPLISVSNDDTLFEKQKKAFTYARALIAKEFMKAKGEKAIGGQKIINLLPNKVRHLIVNRIFEKYAWESSKDVFVSELATNDLCRQYKYSDICDLEKKSYEGCMMYVPTKYHEILSKQYGDYMTPPPIEKRGGHELTLGETIIDAHVNYKEYQ